MPVVTWRVVYVESCLRGEASTWESRELLEQLFLSEREKREDRQYQPPSGCFIGHQAPPTPRRDSGLRSRSTTLEVTGLRAGR
jgi:hypothetical protein